MRPIAYQDELVVLTWGHQQCLHVDGVIGWEPERAITSAILGAAAAAAGQQILGLRRTADDWG